MASRHPPSMSHALDRRWDDPTDCWEPGGWSDAELRDWLTARTDSDLQQASRLELEQQVAAELERLYAAYKPALAVRLRAPINPVSLPLWVPHDVSKPLAMAHEFTFAMFSMQDMLAINGGMPMPLGRAPENDLRRELLNASQVCDSDFRLIQFSTVDEDRALEVSIRRAVLALPQHIFKPGDRVITLAAASSTQASASDVSGGSSGSSTVPPGRIGTVAEHPSREGSAACPAARTGAAAAGSVSGSVSVLFDGGSTSPVQVPTQQLLLHDTCMPYPGSFVVLHGLKQQPELCGRLARVLKDPGTSDDADRRCQVTLVPFLDEEGAAGHGGGGSSGSGSDSTGVSSSQSRGLRHLAPRVACIQAVQQPAPALLVAYAALGFDTPAAITAAACFTACQGFLLTAPHQRLKTTARQHAMLLRYLAKGASLLAPCSTALKQQLLGSLSHEHWTLALLVAMKPPPTAAEQHRQALKHELVCRLCGKAGTKGHPIKHCQRCKAVAYCGRECQAQDWTRHKAECSKRSAAAGAGSSGSDTAGRQGRPAAKDQAADSLCVALGRAELKGVVMLGGRMHDLTKVPTNIHGDSEFLLKITYNATNGPMVNNTLLSRADAVDTTEGDTDAVLLMDRAQSLLTAVLIGQPGHAQLVRLACAVGRPRRLCSVRAGEARGPQPARVPEGPAAPGAALVTWVRPLACSELVCETRAAADGQQAQGVLWCAQRPPGVSV